MTDKRQKLITAVVLFAACIGFCRLFVMQYGIFGSRVDWISQHTVFADYFRKRFYETGNFFPEFAWNIGGGQNIYNFAYYGLYSPRILLSYLLPFVEMDLYMMISGVVVYAAGTVLFYVWISKKTANLWLGAGGALMFSLAAPLLYHAYNQIMFVDYMPFLILALWGVDRHFTKGKSSLLVVGVAGMIFTSFYFAVGGILAVALYAVSVYLGLDEKRGIRGFLKEGIRFAVPVLIAVLLSGILLIPVAAAIFSGRQSSGAAEGKTDWFSAFMPQFQVLKLLYIPYGIGLSSYALTALIGGMGSRKHGEKRGTFFLSVSLGLLLLIPVFGYLLNGGLYSKDKVFIPFLPLVVLLTVRHSEAINDGRKIFWRELLPFAGTILLLLYARNQTYFSDYWKLALADAILMVCLFAVQVLAIHRRSGPYRIPLMLYGSCVILFAVGWSVQKERNVMMTEESYEKTVDPSVTEAVEKILAGDRDWYRIEQYGDGEWNLGNCNRVRNIGQNLTTIYSSAYNGTYQEFRQNTFRINQQFRNAMMQTVTDNPVFLRFMGVKYLIGTRCPAGYTLYQKGESYNIYRSESAFPLAYVTNRVMAESEYRTLSYPESQTILLKKAVVPDEELAAAQSDVTLEKEPGSLAVQEDTSAENGTLRKCTFRIPELDTDTIRITRDKENYELEVKKRTEVKVEPDGIENGGNGDENLLALSFGVENLRPNQDLYIRLLGQTNRLTAENHEYANHNTTFDYLVSLSEGSSEVTVTFGPGHYRITDVQAFAGILPKENEICQGTWKMDGAGVNAYGGDGMSGVADSEKGGYLVTSIPYDPNFTVRIDGKEAEPICVDTSFLGVRLLPGSHRITVEYHAPGRGLGMVLTNAGLLLWVLLGVYQYVNTRIFLHSAVRT